VGAEAHDADDLSQGKSSWYPFFVRWFVGGPRSVWGVIANRLLFMGINVIRAASHTDSDPGIFLGLKLLMPFSVASSRIQIVTPAPCSQTPSVCVCPSLDVRD
jgi:hypothetical protein